MHMGKRGKTGDIKKKRDLAPPHKPRTGRPTKKEKYEGNAEINPGTETGDLLIDFFPENKGKGENRGVIQTTC